MAVQESPNMTSGLKRKRSYSLPLTPPLSIEDREGTRILDQAVHVLHTEATALSHTTRLYQTDPDARNGLLRAIDCITKVNAAGGKLIICGVGKSGLVGMKIVATMKSLGVGASFLHASEALHGDLGDIRQGDALMFVTYSGRTPELLSLLPHIADVPILAITAHSASPLFTERPGIIFLPAPIHELEETSFGVSAPTTSTTSTLAIGDMVALTVAKVINQERTRHVFQKNHPGGAIGATEHVQTEKKPGKGTSRKRVKKLMSSEA